MGAINMRKKSVTAFLLLLISVNAVFGQSVRDKLKTLDFHIIDETNSYIDFELNDLNGRSVKLSDYEGKLIMINFWASWCPPCISEMPSMENLYQKMKGKNFEMLAVNIQEKTPVVKNFVDKNKYTYPVLLDTDADAAAAYMVRSIPTTYIIDTKGKIAGIFIGAREWDSDEVVKVFTDISK